MADRIEILYSPLGMYSLLRDDYIISVIRKDGSLHMERLEALVKYAEASGANGLRELPFWIDSEVANFYLSPFQIDTLGRFVPNTQYWQNQRKIAEMCNKYGVRYWYTLFDHCGCKASMGKFNPWRSFFNYFYGEDAANVRIEYINRALDWFYGLDVGFAIGNELAPFDDCPEMMARTFAQLIKNAFDPKKIMLGMDHLENERTPAYVKADKKFRELVINYTGNSEWEKWLKTDCISPIHNISMERIKNFFGPNVAPGGQRRILYSFDGVRPRPSSSVVSDLTKYINAIKRNAVKYGRVHYEIIFGKQESDPKTPLYGSTKISMDKLPPYPTPWTEDEDKVEPVEPPVAPPTPPVAPIPEYTVGHPAFPSGIIKVAPGEYIPEHKGMSKRFYLYSLILGNFSTAFDFDECDGIEVTEFSMQKVVDFAYRLTDKAMDHWNANEAEEQ